MNTTHTTVPFVTFFRNVTLSLFFSAFLLTATRVAAETAPPPEKLSERAARGTPKDREFLHGAILTVKSWASTDADLKLAGDLRGRFQKWAGDSYADAVRWIEAEQVFGPVSDEDILRAVTLLAGFNTASGKCRIPPELSSLDDFSATTAARIETDLLIPCENLPADDTTSALGAVVQARRALARPKEIAAYLDRNLNGRKLSASLCQATRLANAASGQWKPYDTCAQMLPAGADRADFARGTALELLDLDQPGLAQKSLERPWVSKRETPLFEMTRARILLAQKKTAAFKAALQKILKSDPLDSPDLLWAAEQAGEDQAGILIARLEPVIKKTDAGSEDLSEAATLLEALTRTRCPAISDNLSPAPECGLGKNLSPWRVTLLDRYLNGDLTPSGRRAVQRLLLLLPASAWKGTALNICGGAGAKDAPPYIHRGLATICARIAGPSEASAVRERLQTGGHLERLAVLSAFAANGTDPKLREALKADLQQMADNAALPVSERRNALVALLQTGCGSVAADKLDAFAKSGNALLADVAAQGQVCAASPKPSFSLRARYLDLADSGVIYPAVRQSNGKDVFIVENLKAEPVLKVDSATDYGPELMIGMENQNGDGEVTGESRTLKLYRQPVTTPGTFTYVSERYPTDFNEDGSLRRPPGGGGWTEF